MLHQSGKRMRKGRKKIVGRMYAHRVSEVVRIYEEHAKSGLSNREILRQYIWPIYPMCEATFYNLINASADDRVQQQQREMQMTLF